MVEQNFLSDLPIIRDSQTGQLQEGLNLRSKRPKRSRCAAHRQPALGNASSLHECWSMDFVTDQLYDGSRFRALTVVDNYSRKCLAIYAGKSLKGSDVVGVLG